MSESAKILIKQAMFLNGEIENTELKLTSLKNHLKTTTAQIHDVAKDENFSEEEWAEIIQVAKLNGVTL